MGLMDRTPLTVTPIRAPAVLKLQLQLHSSFDISSSKHYWPEKKELRSDSCCVNGGENCFKHKNSTTLQCCVKYKNKEHYSLKHIFSHQSIIAEATHGWDRIGQRHDLSPWQQVDGKDYLLQKENGQGADDQQGGHQEEQGDQDSREEGDGRGWSHASK